MELVWYDFRLMNLWSLVLSITQMLFGSKEFDFVKTKTSEINHLEGVA